MSEPKKTIVINPDFLKLPMRGTRTRKNAARDNANAKPIKIRSDKPSKLDKTIKKRALNYIRKQQEEKYKKLMKGDDTNIGHRMETTDGKTYADEFKSGFDDSLAFLQKLTDQVTEKAQVKNATLKQYLPPSLPINTPISTLFNTPILNQVLDQNLDPNVKIEAPTIFTPSIPLPFSLPKPTYGCLKGGQLPTYRTMKTHEQLQNNHLGQNIQSSHQPQQPPTTPTTQQIPQRTPRLTPEQQRSELKQFLEKRKEEKQRVERVKRQRHMVKGGKKQKRTTTRTFRVGKSKHYAKVGVLIPNKTIRTQVLAKKQTIRETPLEDVRKYLIKKGLIRVGSSCPNDVLRQMYESSMMMCGEIQNHNADNLLYNYLHNAI